MKINFFFAWYDFWVGFYYSRKDRKLYFCPLPCCVIMVALKKEEESHLEDQQYVDDFQRRRW